MKSEDKKGSKGSKSYKKCSENTNKSKSQQWRHDNRKCKCYKKEKYYTDEEDKKRYQREAKKRSRKNQKILAERNKPRPEVQKIISQIWDNEIYKGYRHN